MAWRQLGDGLRYIRRHRVLAQERGWSAAAFGWIIARFGVGAAVRLVLGLVGALPQTSCDPAYLRRAELPC